MRIVCESLSSLLVPVCQRLLQTCECAFTRVRLGLDRVQLGASKLHLVVLLLEQILKVLNLKGKLKSKLASKNNVGNDGKSV
jgi:hypothetical protein